MSNTSEICLIDIGMQTHMAVKTGEQRLTLPKTYDHVMHIMVSHIHFLKN